MLHKTVIALLIFFLRLSVMGQTSWTKELETIGTFSSPRLSDLNGDGVKDVILGGGRLEFQASDTAFFALDGKSGELLWKDSGTDQIFGSAALMDINNDGVEDIFLNGRSSELKAISGKTGELIWKFDTLQYLPNHIKRWFNFYNPQFIHDLDGDGLKDILIANGGDIWVKPFDPNRASGRLVLISSATGKLLGGAPMPDNKEIYMSAIVNLKEKDPRSSPVVFGTGGETIDGNLYVANLGMVIDGDLSQATKLAIGQGKGFISPPAFVDVNGDEAPDIIAASVNGRLMAFDGVTHDLVWQVKIPGTEAYSSVAVGHFNTDETPDFFVSFAQGVWPDLGWTRQAMINGKNGQVAYLDSLGYYQTSSPVVTDLNDDGIDEVILSVDYQVLDSLMQKEFFTTLFAIDFTQGEAFQLIDGLPGHNVSSTPWIGDMNGNGFLDIVYCHGTNSYHTYTFDGLRINCLQTTIPISKPVKWGSYMGSNYDGIYR